MYFFLFGIFRKSEKMVERSWIYVSSMSKNPLQSIFFDILTQVRGAEI